MATPVVKLPCSNWKTMWDNLQRTYTNQWEKGKQSYEKIGKGYKQTGYRKRNSNGQYTCEKMLNLIHN